MDARRLNDRGRALHAQITARKISEKDCTACMKLIRIATIAAAIGLVMAFEFHELVVHADDQPGGHPLGDKIAPFASAGNLKRQ